MTHSIARAPLTLLALLLAPLAACGPMMNGAEDAPWIGAPGEGIRRTAEVRVDGVPMTLDVEDFDGTYVLEDDMVLDARDVIAVHEELDEVDEVDEQGDGAVDAAAPVDEQALAAAPKGRLWPNGVVYYKLGANLPQYMRKRVRDAMDAWERRTVVEFREAGPNREAFVKIVPFDKPYCRATIGYTGGRTFMWLNDVCSVGLIKHELGHTLGLYHEQSRPDRDEHVRILWENVKPGFAGNFKRYSWVRDIKPYTYNSIMHYSSYAFSKNGRPTIVRRSNGEPFGGWRKRIHDRDAAGIDKIYAAVMQ